MAELNDLRRRLVRSDGQHAQEPATGVQRQSNRRVVQ